MNDPYENQPWSFGGININYEGCYPQTYSSETHIDHQFILGDEIKSSSQIICFVNDEPQKGFLNEIMWAHYSDNHQGVCFELDADTFIQENKKILIDFAFEPVTYGSHEKLFLNWDINLNKDQNILNIIKTNYRNLLLHKSKYWENENEMRLIIFSKIQTYLSIEESLTGVYFGLQFQEIYKPSIFRFINEKKTKLFDLYYENNMLKTIEREKGDYRPLITKKWTNKNS
jgi:hypothetical protein